MNLKKKLDILRDVGWEIDMDLQFVTKKVRVGDIAHSHRVDWEAIRLVPLADTVRRADEEIGRSIADDIRSRGVYGDFKLSSRTMDWIKAREADPEINAQGDGLLEGLTRRFAQRHNKIFDEKVGNFLMEYLDLPPDMSMPEIARHAKMTGITIEVRPRTTVTGVPLISQQVVMVKHAGELVKEIIL